MRIFPETITELWNEWELRVLVLISLSLQIILIMLGKRRKYTTRNWVRFVLWLAYLSADWVATVSLGVLCNMQGFSKSTDSAPHQDGTIMAFWAPFLLLHLGGPDTITAFSLEDNELWLRHFLGLLVQVGVAFYVFLRSWTTGTNYLLFVAIPIFVAGIIKYGERTWVLWSASSGNFRDSLLPPPNPGLDYVKITEKYGEDIDLWSGFNKRPGYERYRVDTNIILDARIFHEAHYFFKIFRCLYADLILSFADINDSYEAFKTKSPNKAFKLIEIELGFIYDVLYTKASLVYSHAGSFLRPISFISTVSAFMGFLIVNKHGYSKINIIISYVLFIGALVLEIYAVIVQLFSDWTVLWLSKHKSPRWNRIFEAIFSRRLAISENKRAIYEKKRWSHSMAQFNLIGFCLRHKPAQCLRIWDCFGVYEKLEKYLQIHLKDITSELEIFVFEHIQPKAKDAEGNATRINEVCHYRGDEVLRAFDDLRWSVEVDFDESILLWHIATDLYCDKCQDAKIPEISKSLSDYMLYLLVMCPFMLPNGIGQIRFQDTVAEAERFFQDRKLPSNRSDACDKLLAVDSRFPQASVKGDVCKSVLFDGCRLAKSLQLLERRDGWDSEKVWKMISNVWVEMLCYAANQCRWNQHAQQLGRGGELLTHVSLLMVHLGLTEQLKVIKGEGIVPL
ncbi:hypothetical protein L1049_015345 [Liquidambar formosana]|uniref:DUF4220 domain-containing protein n=1 Tax=Liquidambar formosana TaxID=63359 RepID=A0AAP0S4L8_LIQFO